MKGVGYRLFTPNEKNDGVITITSPSEGLIVPKGAPLIIEWDYTQESAIINKIDAYWLNNGEDTTNLIEKGVSNNEYYVWNIPESFTDYEHPILIFSEDSSISIYKNPIIRILADPSTRIIDASSFYILDPGYFISAADTSIDLVLEMRDSSGTIYYTGDSSIKINIASNKIDIDNPVTIDSSIYFPGTVDYKYIDIQIANSVNNDVFGTVQQITVI